MSITVSEKWESRLGDGKRLEKMFLVEPTDDGATARQAAYNAAPPSYDGKNKSNDKTRVQSRLTETMWIVSVVYENPDYERLESTDTEDIFSFDTTGGTEHIDRGISVAGFAPSTVPAVEDLFDGLIGASQTGVAGVDIERKGFEFAVTKVFPAASVDNAYLGTLNNLGKTVNDAAFYGFAAGEVLFRGAVGGRRGKGDYEITFKFRASPNQTGLSIDGIEGTIDKGGHEVLDIYFEEAGNNVLEQVVFKPVFAWSHKVYPDGDFTGLGL